MAAHRRLSLLALAYCIGSTQAFAAPTYLTCTIEGNEVKVTSDEQNAAVTIMVAGTPAPQRFNASFSANEVVFADHGIRYTLSRTNRTLVREVARYGWVDRGTCTIDQAPKRAF